MGQKVDFTCAPQSNIAICTITRSGLISDRQTISIPKKNLVKTDIRRKENDDGPAFTRIVLITTSGREIPFIDSWTDSPDGYNQQLLARQNQIDNFLKDPLAQNFSLTTSYPWLLWACLGFLGLLCFIVSIVWRNL